MKLKKRYKNLISIITILGALILLIGCGGGGDDKELLGIIVYPHFATIAVGGTQQFKASGYYKELWLNPPLFNITNAVTWTSSNTAVATVNSSGLATGVAVGIATITATSGSISDSSPLTVTVPTTSTLPVYTNPTTIAIDSLGNMWVTNYGNNNVTKLSPSGALLDTLDVGNGLQSVHIDPLGNIWVTNAGSDSVSGNTVTKLSPSGMLLGTFTVGDNPSCVSIDSKGNVWVDNYGEGTVTVLKGASSQGFHP